jgi:hypothetical protein
MATSFLILYLSIFERKVFRLIPSRIAAWT